MRDLPHPAELSWRGALAAGLTIGVLCWAGCASTPTLRPVGYQPDAAPYAQEVYADEPLAHWRLSGPTRGAVEGDDDGASTFERGEGLKLLGADIGGPEVAVEAWLKDPRGTALAYAGPGGKPALSMEVSKTLTVVLFGVRHDTEVALDGGRWHHVGVSWRGSDGLMMVSVNGVLRHRTWVSKGDHLPYDGQWIAGEGYSGQLDEVAAFDQIKFPSDWLHRVRVARALSDPTLPDEQHPVRVVVQGGHVESVATVSWSPNGARIATGSWDNTAKIWDAATGALVHDLAGHTGWVNAAAWSPDGTRLTTASSDNTAKIWDAVSGSRLHKLQGHRVSVEWASWSPDSTRIATTSDDATKIWNAHTGQLIHDLTAPKRSGNAAVWSPDGARIAITYEDGSVAIRDTATGALVHTLDDHAESVLSASWSPDGARIATTSKDMTAKIWDASTGQRLHSLEDHDKEVVSASWSPNGDRLVTASEDHTAKVWDAHNGQLVHDLTDHTGLVLSVSWNPNGDHIVTGSWDDTAKVWDAHTGKLIHDLKGRSKGVNAVSWSPDGAHIAIANKNNTAQTWDAHTGQLVHDLEARSKRISAAAWSPSGNRIASVGPDGAAQLWDAHTGKLVHGIQSHPFTAIATGWSPDGTRFATTSPDKTAKVWDASTGALVHDLIGHTGWVNAVSWSPDGDHIATASQDNTARIWDANTGQPIHALEGHLDALKSMAWSPNSAQVATGGWDGTAKVWDVSTGKLVQDLTGHTGWINTVSWSPDGAHIATASQDNTAKIWDVRTGALVHDLTGHIGRIKTVSWSPDSARLLTASEDHTARIWDASTGASLHRLDGHHAPLRAASWSPNSAQVATGGWDGTTKVWDANTGQTVLALKDQAGSVESVLWSPDGARIATTSTDNTLRVWELASGHSVTLLATPSGGWLAVTDRGAFAGSANARGLLALVQGSRVFGFEQVAPVRNRPDKVFEILGAPTDLIDFQKILWLRRLARMNLAPEGVGEDFSSAPVARIVRVGPTDGAGRVDVEIVFKDRAGLAGYRVHVNGVPTPNGRRPLTGQRQRLAAPVQLTRGTNTIEITAINAQGIESLRASTTLHHDGQGLPEPRLFFVGFGVSDYKDDRLDLGFAHQDVLDLAATFRASAPERFYEVQIQAHIDADVTEQAVAKMVDVLASATEHDTLIMFVAGHGVRGQDKSRTYYYLDHDTDLANLEDTAIPFEQMEALLYRTRARKKLFLLDTCQSGEDVDIGTLTAELEGVRGLKARSLRGLKHTGSGPIRLAPHTPSQDDANTRMWLSALRTQDRLILEDLTRRSGAIVLASSLGRESSLETAQWANGAFTEELLRALQSHAADTNKDGLIDTDELAAHVAGAVPRLTGQRQHPNVERDNPLQKFALPIQAP